MMHMRQLMVLKEKLPEIHIILVLLVLAKFGHMRKMKENP